MKLLNAVEFWHKEGNKKAVDEILGKAYAVWLRIGIEERKSLPEVYERLTEVRRMVS